MRFPHAITNKTSQSKSLTHQALQPRNILRCVQCIFQKHRSYDSDCSKNNHCDVQDEENHLNFPHAAQNGFTPTLLTQACVCCAKRPPANAWGNSQRSVPYDFRYPRTRSKPNNDLWCLFDVGSGHCSYQGEIGGWACQRNWCWIKWWVTFNFQKRAPLVWSTVHIFVFSYEVQRSPQRLVQNESPRGSCTLLGNSYINPIQNALANGGSSLL